MNTDLFIKRPVMTTLLMAGLLIFGLMAYRQLPVSDLPNVDFPTVQVSASLPGASPDTMASAVATPLDVHLMIIDPEQSAVGYAEQRPTATNATEGGRRQNRRVEIVLERLNRQPQGEG